MESKADSRLLEETKTRRPDMTTIVRRDRLSSNGSRGRPVLATGDVKMECT